MYWSANKCPFISLFLRFKFAWKRGGPIKKNFQTPSLSIHSSVHKTDTTHWTSKDPSFVYDCACKSDTRAERVLLCSFFFFLQHSNADMRNYALNGAFASLPSAPCEQCVWSCKTERPGRREAGGGGLQWCCVWVINAARTPANKCPRREEPQITETHSHIYNYNERSWGVVPGGCMQLYKRATHTHTHLEDAVSCNTHTHTHS